VHGCIGQGVGQALVERTVYNVDGLVHGLRHAARRQPAELRLSLDRDPCKTNPLGIKGSGEAGAIGAAPALMNALIDALSP
jgi:aerobic carbon-monoxide dehydrogenase large subunit